MDMRIGRAYRLHRRDWTTPFGETIPGKPIEGLYQGQVIIESETFVVIQRLGGPVRPVLVCTRTINHIEQLTKPIPRKEPA